MYPNKIQPLRSLNLRDNTIVGINNKDLLGIPISSFFNGVVTKTDIYIQLSDSKFVLIFKRGHPIDLSQLKKYQDQNITELFVHKDDYPILIKKQVIIASKAIESPQVKPRTKIALLSRIADSVYDEFDKMGFEKQALDNAKEISNSVVQLVHSKPQIEDLLESLNKISDEVFKHSMSVSFMAPLIGRAMEWTRPETLEKLGLGGLLHDIGKRELSPEIINKSRNDMTYEELKDYENHAYRGMQILSAVPDMPADVIAITYEHHENSLGQGYPRRLWDMKINPLARVVALANLFCELTLWSPNYPKKMTPQEAIDHIENVLGQPFNKTAFRALKSLVEKKDLS